MSYTAMINSGAGLKEVGGSRLRTIRATGTVVLLGAALAMSGCGGEDEPAAYSKESVCGIPSEIVSAVVGDNRYEVSQRGSDSLPLGPGTDSNNGISCEIEQDGRLLVEFSAHRTSADDLAQRIQNAESADEHYAHANGTLGFSAEKKGVDDGYAYEGWWICGTKSPDGTQVASATATSSLGTKKHDFQALLEAVATAAGCD
ncbi:hypothetical protein [Nocardioides albertanoniae]|uniref:hypothetical protein n=1 Tax=Nocardioides albertanoniae TaxID=1175486 RepID=UPI001150AB52|nr:hypothetical protein [Nocardioides albertanoniae]